MRELVRRPSWCLALTNSAKRRNWTRLILTTVTSWASWELVLVPWCCWIPKRRMTLRYTQSSTQSHVYTLTHSYTHSYTHSPTHSLTHSYTHSLIHTLTHLLTHSFIHTLTHSLTHSYTHSSRHSLNHFIFPTAVCPGVSACLFSYDGGVTRWPTHPDEAEPLSSPFSLPTTTTCKVSESPWITRSWAGPRSLLSA